MWFNTPNPLQHVASCFCYALPRPRVPAPPSPQLTVKFRTAQLEHEFGCPYQLGHHRYANSPCDADLAALPVSPGDVIIMGSDGLLDNMSETEVVNEVSKLVASGLRPAAMAQQIAKVGFGVGGGFVRASSV